MCVLILCSTGAEVDIAGCLSGKYSCGKARSSRLMSSKCAMSGPASAKVAEWNDEDFEDLELVSSGGEPGDGSIECTDSAMVGTVKERTRGLSGRAVAEGGCDAASICSIAWSSFREG
jgi:hypothetical protein